MDTVLQAAIIGFREGLEGFLVVSMALRFFGGPRQARERRGVWIGASFGVGASAVFGGLLYLLGGLIMDSGRAVKLWEPGASLAALTLVTTFIVWMIRHGSELSSAVEKGMSAKTGARGIALVVFAMILREGVEVSLFAFAGSYSVPGILFGLAAALVLVWLVFAALVKVNLAAIFSLTMAYLVLQAGFLLGYGIHEGLSAGRDAGILQASNPLLVKAFDLSNTLLDHKTGALGIPLYAFVGWYSRPEWVQFLAQYLYTISIFAYWAGSMRREKAKRGRNPGGTQ